MKKFFLLYFLLTGLYGFSQTKEKFDIATYTVPTDWKKEVKSDVVTYTYVNQTAGSYLVMAVYKSVAGLGQLQKDYSKEWEELVAKRYTITGKPETETGKLEDGWNFKTGAVTANINNAPAIAVLTVFQKAEIVVSLLALMNKADMIPPMENFISSVKLDNAKAPINSINPNPALAPNAAVAIAAKPAINADARLFGKWNRSGAFYPHYADPASWGTAGYTSSRYEFKKDGSYQFTERSFRMTYQYIIIVKENGTYTVNGKELTIVPANSVIQHYTKKNNVDELGSLVKSGNRALEKVTYNYQFHYFPGIREWNLVLQASKPTQRDGSFSSNSTFSNAWYFDQKYTNNDLTSSTGK